MVRPKSGRAVLMDQDILHRVSAPSSAAGGRPRYSLVWKLVQPFALCSVCSAQCHVGLRLTGRPSSTADTSCNCMPGWQRLILLSCHSIVFLLYLSGSHRLGAAHNIGAVGHWAEQVGGCVTKPPDRPLRSAAGVSGKVPRATLLLGQAGVGHSCQHRVCRAGGCSEAEPGQEADEAGAGAARRRAARVC